MSPFAVNNLPTTYANNGKRRTEDLDLDFFDSEGPSKRAKTDVSSSLNASEWDLFGLPQPDWMNWYPFTNLAATPSSSTSALTLPDAFGNTHNYAHQHTGEYNWMYNAEPGPCYLDINMGTQSVPDIFGSPVYQERQQQSEADRLFESEVDAFLANFLPDASGNFPVLPPAGNDSLLLQAAEPTGASFANDAPGTVTKVTEPGVNTNTSRAAGGSGLGIQTVLEPSGPRDKVVDRACIRALKAEFADCPRAVAYLEKTLLRFSDLYTEFRKVEAHRPYTCKWRVQQGTSFVLCGAQISHSTLSKHIGEHFAAEGHKAKNGYPLRKIPNGKVQCKWGECDKEFGSHLPRHISAAHESHGRRIGYVEVEGDRPMAVWGNFRRDQTAHRLEKALRGVLEDHYRVQA